MPRPRLYFTPEAVRAANIARTIRVQAERKARHECPTCGVPVTQYIYCLRHRLLRSEASKRSQAKRKAASEKAA